jgi:DnaA family protein
MNFSPQLPFDFSVSEHFTFANLLVPARNAELVDLLKDLEHYTEPVAFVWGSEGCGKTHLLQAVCRDQEDRGALQALYLPMARIRVFGPEVFASLHHMDLICLDDLHLVAGDKAWEEALFEFFNRSREAGVRLLVTALQSPRGIEFALPDLASRMAWGVTYQLHELSDEDKLAALDQRAREKNMPLPLEVLSYIFNRHPRDLQGLLAVMETLDKLSLAEKRRLTIPFVRKVMNWQ